MTDVKDTEDYINNIENKKNKKVNADKLKDEVNNVDRKMMRW